MAFTIGDIALYFAALNTPRRPRSKFEKSSAGILIPLLMMPVTMTPVLAQSYVEAWRQAGFVQPESASWDSGTKSLFVSNISSENFEANGQGYISQLGIDGNVIKEKFIEGLDAPKGTAIADGKLYVAAVEALVEIDIASATIANTYPAPGATFLNDVAVAPDGKVYVTETMQGAIYVLEDGALSQFLADPQLAGANGIIVDGAALLVATLGDMSAGFENMKPSNVKSVDIASKAVTDYGSPDPIGGLDGIELMDEGVMVTDHPAGRLVQVKPDGSVVELAMPGAGAADIEYVPEESLVVVPMLQSAEVVAYTTAQ
jgi:sugar lactone lactonase YvrE